MSPLSNSQRVMLVLLFASRAALGGLVVFFMFGAMMFASMYGGPRSGSSESASMSRNLLFLWAFAEAVGVLVQIWLAGCAMFSSRTSRLVYRTTLAVGGVSAIAFVSMLCIENKMFQTDKESLGACGIVGLWVVLAIAVFLLPNGPAWKRTDFPTQ